MAYSLTYDTLFNNVLAYLERNDENLQNAIPNFIFLAQKRIANDLKTLVSEQYVTGTFQVGQPIVQKPAQWLNSVTTNINNLTDNSAVLVPIMSYEFCKLYWPNKTETGTPKYYCDYGYDNWLFVPTPDQAYPFEIAFLGFPTPIDQNNQTNAITDRVPHLLEYATFSEAMIYIKNDERIQFFESKYTNALQGLINEDQNRYADRYYDRSKD